MRVSAHAALAEALPTCLARAPRAALGPAPILGADSRGRGDVVDRTGPVQLLSLPRTALGGGLFVRLLLLKLEPLGVGAERRPWS